MIPMTKSTISAVIESELLEEARKKNINISQAAESGIASVLLMGDSNDFKRKPNKIERVLENLSSPAREDIIIRFKRDGFKHIKDLKKRILESTGIKLNDEDFHQIINILIGKEPLIEVENDKSSM